MNLAIIGYGKMGKTIEKIAIQRGHKVVLKTSSQTPIFTGKMNNVDVAIEFTRPESAVDNIYKCFEEHTPVVSGTTGWYSRLPEVRSECNKRSQSLVYASNFSLGMNILFALNSKLGQIMNQYDSYVPSIEETHHIEKLDQPSGTAITLAEDMVYELSNYESWTEEEASAEKIAVKSIRLGDVKGEHKIRYENEIDRIELSHLAHSRDGFALGAIIAAEWIIDNPGCHTFKEVLKF